MSKYGMSMIVLGLAGELKKYRIGVNALWPRTTIATAAVQNLLGGDYIVQRSRKPTIVADAAYAVLKKNAAECTGNFFFDEDVLRDEGTTDFTPYAVNPEQPLMPDIFID
jgi:citronellol/citronellal dehydrogenase